MFKLYVNQKFPSDEWLKQLYSGSMFLWTTLKSARALGDFAEDCIKKHFGGSDYLTSYRDWPIHVFVEKATALKKHYTNCQEVKDIIRDFVVEIGENPDQYFFDVPRLRIVPNVNYLKSGVSHNYANHRDTWYGSPACGVNTWMPIFPIKPEASMALFPSYFSSVVENSSREFDAKDWITVQRSKAQQQVHKETRKHPEALVEVDEKAEVLVGGGRGDMLVFAGQHLHGSRENLGETIRFSTDFRLFLEDDLNSCGGPKNIDNECLNGYYYPVDFFRVSDLSRYTLKGEKCD